MSKAKRVEIEPIDDAVDLWNSKLQQEWRRWKGCQCIYESASKAQRVEIEDESVEKKQASSPAKVEYVLVSLSRHQVSVDASLPLPLAASFLFTNTTPNVEISVTNARTQKTRKITLGRPKVKEGVDAVWKFKLGKFLGIQMQLPVEFEPFVLSKVQVDSEGNVLPHSLKDVATEIKRYFQGRFVASYEPPETDDDE
jgi:hypothetical protein